MEINVDTTSPEIEELNYEIDRRRVEFDISITEDVDIEYMDENDKRPRWRSFCRNCDSYERMKTFTRGEHDLLIRAMDKATNTDERRISFQIN